MSYVELEQFLDRGSIRAWWGLSWRTFFGCAAGAVIGQQVGAVLFGADMWGSAGMTLLGATLGLVLLLKRRGIIVARRLLVLASFGLRVASKRTIIDGAALSGSIRAADPHPMQVRVRYHEPPPLQQEEPYVPRSRPTAYGIRRRLDRDPDGAGAADRTASPQPVAEVQ